MSIPIVLSTWKHGLPANEAAWEILKRGGSALDAVEQGVRVSESDPEVHSVGLGGRPNREGVVQLDAAIMDGRSGRVGAVAALESIENPVSVARAVLEKTSQVLLAGAGALKFALAQGFTQAHLLTPESEHLWRAWQRGERRPPEDTHDTIGMCALDQIGNLAVACTTSGLAWKIPGRVGDSPICGAGLYCENGIGAACATGVGEEALQTCGSFLVVELMRQGRSPEEACSEACQRIRIRAASQSRSSGLTVIPGNVMYLAVRADGTHGGWSVSSGCEYALQSENTPNSLIACPTEERT